MRCHHGFGDAFYCPDCGGTVKAYIKKKADEMGLAVPENAMTLRDKIAVELLPTLLLKDQENFPARCCVRAYEIADLMVKARGGELAKEIEEHDTVI